MPAPTRSPTPLFPSHPGGYSDPTFNPKLRRTFQAGSVQADRRRAALSSSNAPDSNLPGLPPSPSPAPVRGPAGPSPTLWPPTLHARQHHPPAQATLSLSAPSHPLPRTALPCSSPRHKPDAAPPHPRPGHPQQTRLHHICSRNDLRGEPRGRAGGPRVSPAQAENPRGSESLRGRWGWMARGPTSPQQEAAGGRREGSGEKEGSSQN